MDAADELQQEGLFDFLVAVDGGEETLGHVLVFITILLYLLDLFHLGLSKSRNDLVPNPLLVEFLLRLVLAPLHLLVLLVELVELVVFHFDVDGHEDQLVAEVPHALDASYPALSIGHSSSLVASGGQLRLLSGFQHAGKLRKDAEVADDLAYVSRLPLFGELVAENNVYRARHGSWRNLGGILLDPNLLEISKCALGHLQLPRIPIAIFSGAFLRFGILELLNDFFADLSTGPALEDSDLELRPHFRRACDRPFQFDQLSEVLALEPPDAVLEPLIIAVIETALVGLPIIVVSATVDMEDVLLILEHKLGECLIDDGFVFVVLIEDKLGKVGVVMYEISEGEHDVMAGIIDCIFGGNLVLGLTVFSPVLDELGELSLDGVAQVVLLQFVLPLDVHGA